MELIEVKVKGYKIYCMNEFDEMYDFFIPKEEYRISIKESKSYVPERHHFLAVRRDTESYYVTLDDLKSIKQK